MRPCNICRSENRSEIESALLTRGESFRSIAKRYGTSSTAVFRHKAHIPDILARSTHAQSEKKAADSLFSRLRRLHDETWEIFTEMRKAKSSPSALAGIIARVERQLELEARLIGELNESKVNVNINAEMEIDLLSEENLAVFTPEERHTFITLLTKLRHAAKLELPEGDTIEIETGDAN